MTSDDQDSDAPRRVVPTDPNAGSWTSLEAWKALPTEPDLEREFGYETADWDVIEQDNGSDNVIFLPADQQALADDAFIVAQSSDVCDVGAHR
jgi:hypothetical protein